MISDSLVSRATPVLEKFAGLLLEANKVHNLVAASTIPDMWNRHILDSAQLIDFLPSLDVRLVDLGSGAGFPGLVLAILGVREVHLVESIGKKAKFLQHVVDCIGIDNVHVHAQRIEDLPQLNADIITARALKPLPELLKLAKPLMAGATTAVFMKGKNLTTELTMAKQEWIFDAESHPSKTDPTGSVLVVTRIAKHHVKLSNSRYSKSKRRGR